MSTTSTKYFKGKAIYNPSGAAREYSYWACNFYNGCSNDCQYCYMKKPPFSSTWSVIPTLKKVLKDEETALEIFKKELIENLAELQEHGLLFNFNSDPAIAETYELNFKAIGFAIKNKVPVKMLTKKTTFLHHFYDTPECRGFFKDYLAVGFTLTGHDELEPNASTNAERVEAMKKLHDAGFKTFASMEPIVDFKSTFHYIQETLHFCDLYKIGLMSGATYNKREAIAFIESLLTILERPVIYCKQSLKDLIGFLPERHYTMFVGRDYNMFKTKTFRV